MSDSKQKTNFAILNKVDAFYTEGKIQATEDGNYLLCSFGEKINFLSVSSGTVEHSLAHEDEVEVANFLVSPNNKILVTANKDGVLRQWCMETKKIVRYWRSEHRSLVSCMDYDRTSTLLATGSADSTVKVWDLDQQCCTNILRGHVGVVSIVKLNPHKRYQLVSASDDYKIKIWDLQTHLCDAELKGHCSAVTALQFADDAKSMYSASRDQAVIIWNLQTFTKTSTIPVFESVESMVLLPTDYKEFTFKMAKTGDLFVIAGNKGVLSLWDASKAKCIYKTKEIEKDSSKGESDAGLHTLTQCGFVKATDSIFTVSADGNLSVYSRKDLHLQKQFTGHNGQISDIKFLGKNDSHIAVATNSSLLKVYDVATWSCQILSGHTDNIVSLDSLTTDDSSYIVSGSKDNKICLWKMNLESSVVEKLAVGVGHTHTVTSVSFFDHSSKNGSEVLSIVTGSTDHTIKRWKTKKAEDGEMKLDSMLTVEAHAKDVNSIACFHGKKLIATASQDKTAKLWNEDLSLLGVFKGHKRGIWCVQLHPLDTILATASADTTIKLWNVNDFTCVKTFEGHESSVLKINFLFRGMQLVSCGSDGLMKLWKVQTMECVKTIDAHDEKVWSMAVNAAEDRIVTGATDGCIIVWKDVSEEEKQEAAMKSQDLLLKEQELMNLCFGKQFVKALSLAITLNQPSRALNIVKEILKSSPDSLEAALADLREDQIDILLGFAAVWNQNTKLCNVAHVILNTVLKMFTVDQMLQLGNIKTLVEGLIPYTERHYARMGQLAMKATFTEFIWRTMNLSAPPEMNGSKSLEEEKMMVAQEEDMEITLDS